MRPKEWSRSLKGGGRFLEVPPARFWFGVLFRRPLMGGVRLREVVPCSTVLTKVIDGPRTRIVVFSANVVDVLR